MGAIHHPHGRFIIGCTMLLSISGMSLETIQFAFTPATVRATASSKHPRVTWNISHDLTESSTKGPKRLEDGEAGCPAYLLEKTG